jgi:cytochrome c oxidase cbb3-type subunit 3
MSDFWSIWIIVLTVVSIVGITWILFANRKTTAVSEDQTTGHEYDGITELDNPLPAWWFYMFVFTILWGIGYLIFYPGMGKFAGLLHWTQVEQHQQRTGAAEEKYRVIRDGYLALPVEEIAIDPAVRKMGMRLFQNNCAQCHGADAKGSLGFPNLADGEWLYGGSPEAIKASINDGRQAAMPGWRDIIGDDGVLDVTAYLLSLQGETQDAAKTTAGEKVFQTYCVACHGAEAGGNQALGAPSLKDGIWLYGGSPEQIRQSVGVGRSGLMPAHKEMLNEAKIHILAAYVYGLSQ